MKFIVSGSTDVGIKKEINQDSFFVKKVTSSIGNIVLACICDGMGGLENGEVASATVLYSFDAWLHNSLPELTSSKLDEKEVEKQWRKIIDEDNDKIRSYGIDQNVSLGTTLTVVLLTEKRYIVANVGDTRAYKINKKISQITKDHSFVQREVDNNRMTMEEARHSKKRNVLTQCIGVKETVYPDFYFGKTTKNTMFMLCSDGFRHKLTDEEILSNYSISKLRTAEGIKQKEAIMIEYNKERHETDNITVVSILCK